MTLIVMRYIYDWTVLEGLRDVLHQYNANFECEKDDKEMICTTEVPNPGIHEIKVRGPEIVAVGKNDVIMGERIVTPSDEGKLKIVTKIYKVRKGEKVESWRDS